MSNLCKTEKVLYTQASNLGESIKIQTPHPDAFRSLTKLLTLHKIPYHTYALPEERKVRAVLRGIPHELPNEAIQDDLVAQGFPVEAVYKMHSRTGKQFPLALVILTATAQSSRDIFRRDLTVCGLSKVKVEPPHRRGSPGQCHRCQLYGHAAANCSAQPRCVKCLDPHLTKECSRTPNTPTPPACVLCGQIGHPANYKGCPRAPKPKAKAKGSKKNSPLQATDSSQRPTPPVMNNNNFPSLPRAAPLVAATPLTVWNSARAVSKPEPRPSGTSVFPDDNFRLVAETISKVDLQEVDTLAEKLKKARTPYDRFVAIAEHSAMFRALS